MTKSKEGNQKAEKKVPEKNLKEKRADKKAKRIEKSKSSSD